MTTPTVSADFLASAISDLGVSVTRTPVAVTIDNISGQKTYTDGTDETITAVWNNPTASYSLQESGLAKVTPDAVMYVAYSQTINKHDKIVFGGNTYRVTVVNLKTAGNDNGFKKVELFLI